MNPSIRTTCILAALLLGAASASAADARDAAAGSEIQALMTRKGKPIFSEDFAGPGIDPKWVRPKGNWSIADGALKGGERKEDNYSGSSKVSFDFADAVLQFDLKFDGAGKASFAIDSAKGHVGRLTIAPNGFTIQKDASSNDPADPRRVLDTAAFAFEPGKWYTVMVEFCGDEVLARVDDRHFVLGADPKFKRDKTRVAFGVHGQFIHVDNVRAFAATPNPDWPAARAKLQAQHAPPPTPPVTGPDHFKNAQAQKKRKAEAENKK